MATATRPQLIVSEPLWMVAVAPAIWLSHFTACYLTAAFGCATWSSGAAMGGAHAAITVYTAGALLGIGLCLVMGVNAWRDATDRPRRIGDEAESRQRAIASVTVLAALVSLLGAIAVANYAWAVSACL